MLGGFNDIMAMRGLRRAKERVDRLDGSSMMAMLTTDGQGRRRRWPEDLVSARSPMEATKNA
jgi:hypothetical protein